LNNAPELPQFGPIAILLLNLIEHLIVGEDFLILIIMMEQQNLNHSALPWSWASLLLNGLDNAGTEPLTILLGIKKKGAINKVGS